jgi:hypothetical protein
MLLFTLLASCAPCFDTVTDAVEVLRFAGGADTVSLVPTDSGYIAGWTWTSGWDGGLVLQGLDGQGQPVTEATTAVEADDGYEFNGASLAWTGDELGVAWADGGLWFGTWNSDLTESLAPIELHVPDGETGLPRIAGADDRFGLLWGSGFGTTDVHFLQVTAAGDPMHEVVAVFDGGSRNEEEFQLHWTGERWGATWMGDYGGGWSGVPLPRYTWFNEAGEHIGDLGTLDDGHSQDISTPRLAWTGDDWFIGYGGSTDEDGYSGGRAYALKMDADGVITAGESIQGDIGTPVTAAAVALDGQTPVFAYVADALRIARVGDDLGPDGCLTELERIPTELLHLGATDGVATLFWTEQDGEDTVVWRWSGVVGD